MADPILTPPIGDNGPPLVETALMAIQDQLAPFKARLDELLGAAERAVCDSPENAGKCADLAKQLKKLRDRVDSVRKDVKEPYAEAGNAVQAQANGWFKTIDDAGNGVRAMIKKFDDEQRKIEDARRQAEAQQRREQEERERVAGVQAQPVRELEAPKKAAPVASGDYGAAAHRTMRKVPVITDVYALPPEVLNAPRVHDAILMVVRGMRQGNPDMEIRGIEVRDEAGLSIR